MGEIDGVQAPGRTGLGVGLAQGRPEKGELVAEGLACPGLEMPHPIPPLGFILRVGAVVGGELPTARLRRLKGLLSPGSGGDKNCH